MTHTQATITYGHGYLDDFNNGIYSPTVYTATSNGAADGTTIINTVHSQANDYWNGRTVKMLTGTCAGETCLISDFDNGTDTITLTGVGFSDQIDSGDTYQITNWQETEDGNTATLSTSENDYLDIAVSASAGNKVCYYSYPSEATNHDTHLSLSTTTYTKAYWRYKCGNSTIKAKIVLVFSDASTQVLVNDANSTTLTVGSATTTTGKTLDHIRFYADDAAAVAATDHVYYDFLLVCRGVFTIPNAMGGIDWEPTPRYGQLAAAGMIGAHTQNLGSELAEWQLTGDLTQGTWTRSGDTLEGQVFVDISHNSSTEPWQWFNSGKGQCKVTLDKPVFHRLANGSELDWTISLLLREKRNSTAGNTHETYITRFHLDLIT